MSANDGRKTKVKMTKTIKLSILGLGIFASSLGAIVQDTIMVHRHNIKKYYNSSNQW